MPFPKQESKSFTHSTVLSLKEGQMGCYGLFKSGTWVYVGEGEGDIRARLLDHLNGDNACITREQPTHWLDEVTDDHVEREKELIREFAPACNKRVG